MRALTFFFVTCALLLACDSVDLIWMPHSARADPLFRFINKGRAGFIDRTGHVVIPPKLRPISSSDPPFYEGLLSLGVSSGPFLTTKGQVVLDNRFWRIWDFSEGLAAALQTSDSKWGYIDRSGKFVIAPQFPFFPEGLVSDFSDGLAAIEVDGKLGYIDHTGAFVIPRQFATGTSFEDGIARVVVTQGPCAYVNYDAVDPCLTDLQVAPSTGNAGKRTVTANLCRWTFIDKKGNRIMNAEFDAARGFHEDLAAVKVGQSWGFIDKHGTFVIPPIFHGALSFSDGLALVRNDKMSGFIDKTGALKIPLDSSKAGPFSEGLSVYGRLGEGYIFIDTKGRQAMPDRFVVASRFVHGLAHVKVNGDPVLAEQGGTFAYIDRKGRRVFSYRP